MQINHLKLKLLYPLAKHKMYNLPPLPPPTPPTVQPSDFLTVPPYPLFDHQLCISRSQLHLSSGLLLTGTFFSLRVQKVKDMGR